MTIFTPNSRCICFCVFPRGPTIRPKKLYPGWESAGTKILRVFRGGAYDSGNRNEAGDEEAQRRATVSSASARAASHFRAARAARVFTRVPSRPYTGSGDGERRDAEVAEVAEVAERKVRRVSSSSVSVPSIAARLIRASAANAPRVASSASGGASRSHRNDTGSFASTPPGSNSVPACGVLSKDFDVSTSISNSVSRRSVSRYGVAKRLRLGEVGTTAPASVRSEGPGATASASPGRPSASGGGASLEKPSQSPWARPRGGPSSVGRWSSRTLPRRGASVSRDGGPRIREPRVVGRLSSRPRRIPRCRLRRRSRRHGEVRHWRAPSTAPRRLRRGPLHRARADLTRRFVVSFSFFEREHFRSRA